jgi:hypothetical protein
LVSHPRVSAYCADRSGCADDLADRVRAHAPEIRVGPDRAGPVGAEATTGDGSATSVEQRVALAAGRVVAARQRQARLLVGRHPDETYAGIADEALAAICRLAARLRLAGDEETELTRAVAEAAQRCLETFHGLPWIDA